MAASDEKLLQQAQTRQWLRDLAEEFTSDEGRLSLLVDFGEAVIEKGYEDAD